MKPYIHKPREERLREIIIGQTLVTLLIVSVSLYLVFWGFGYRWNWKTKTLSHTGIVYVSFAPKDASVEIPGQSVKQKQPFDASLLPGNYNITVSKVGYQSWNQNFKVLADEVISFRNITLFKVNPIVEIITDKDAISSIDAPYDTLVKNPDGGLNYNDHEIWAADTLVTRISNTISGVIWYPGSEYIAYQQGDEIRIIEKNGTNDALLVKLTSTDKSKFLFSWDGAYLLYKDGIAYKKAIIK